MGTAMTVGPSAFNPFENAALISSRLRASTAAQSKPLAVEAISSTGRSHRTIKPRPHHLRYAARIVAVRLVDLRLQHRLHVPRLNADHRQSCFGESAEQPL